MNKPVKIIIAAVLAAALVCVAVFARNIGVVTDDGTSTSESVVSSSDITETETQTDNTTETQTQTEQEINTADSTSKKAVSTTEAGTTKKETPSGNSASSDEKETSDVPEKTTAEAKPSEQPKSNAVTLTIDCTAADGGYLLRNYRVSYRDGDSAYDILKHACSENGISINAKSTGYGIYVAGINGLNEKDIGDNSGWLYYVNGNLPNKACSKYTVHPGDSVKFYYTVNFSTGN